LHRISPAQLLAISSHAFDDFGPLQEQEFESQWKENALPLSVCAVRTGNAGATNASRTTHLDIKICSEGSASFSFLKNSGSIASIAPSGCTSRNLPRIDSHPNELAFSGSCRASFRAQKS
jgi:hypothetical protein